MSQTDGKRDKQRAKPPTSLTCRLCNQANVSVQVYLGDGKSAPIVIDNNQSATFDIEPKSVIKVHAKGKTSIELRFPGKQVKESRSILKNIDLSLTPDTVTSLIFDENMQVSLYEIVSRYDPATEVRCGEGEQ